MTTQKQNLTKNVDKILTGTESLPRSLPGTAALQPMMDAKLNDKRFWYYHGKGHVKTNQTISQLRTNGMRKNLKLMPKLYYVLL